MKPGRFLKAVSYIFPIPLDRKRSGQSGWISLSLDRGELKLSTENAIYSFGRHYRSFRSVFDEIGDHISQVDSVLVLGYGTGSIARLLSERVETRIKLTGVDNDPDILEWAEHYQDPPFNITLRLENMNARDFVLNGNGCYDLICMDIFIDNRTPSEFLEEDFLERLTGMLSDKGIILYSKLNLDEHDKAENVKFERFLEKKEWPFKKHEVKGNIIFEWKSAG